MGSLFSRLPTLARHQLYVLALASLVFLFNLGGARLWDEDEPKNAQCAREMLSRGDWIVPTFNQELRTDKPVLLYWLMMPAYVLLGVNELAARLPSALLAVGTSLVTYHLGRQLFSPRVGLWAAIILATSLMFTIAGRAATPDSTLIFFATLAMLLFALRVHGKQERGHTPTWRDHAMVFCAMGFAVLAKGPVGLVLPLGIFVLYQRSRIGRTLATCPAASTWPAATWSVLKEIASIRPWWKALWASRPVLAVAIVAAIALPWYIAVGVQTDGEWLQGFLGKHNIDRFLKPMEGHRGPIVYYIPAILIGTFPWSIFLPLALFHFARGWRRGDTSDGPAKFILCWAGLFVGFFSLASTKLPSYVLPAYPALAIVIAVFIDRWISEPVRYSQFWIRLALGSLTTVGVALCIALPIVSHLLLPGEYWLGAVGLVPLIGGGLMFWWNRQEQISRVAGTMAATAVLFSISLFGIVGPRISLHQNSEPLGRIARELSGERPTIGTFADSTPSLVFYAADHIHRLHDPDRVNDFFAATPQGLLVTRTKSLEALQAALPADVVVLERQRKFLRRDEIVLLGRKALLAGRQSKISSAQGARR